VPGYYTARQQDTYTEAMSRGYIHKRVNKSVCIASGSVVTGCAMFCIYTLGSTNPS
jgi:hypothetical protein